MKYLAFIAALTFTGSVYAVDCVECHEKVNVEEHTEMDATMATCNDCHDMDSAHEIDKEVHTPELTIKECADCHEQ
ncbi:cytochrome c3 family protein [Shewanella intestini]|uniref:Class III cytochrome C domain-containing protein n=1 Tax=Shewanella intestini TaxID=2017544 RepID=A0ABS5I3D9_9GAMM|nr:MULTISPECIES: cytochrome c3 family protein [Shewanella]MBR9728543.1 hypothetical protein [Shewanella intestini]MRG36362.1 hypothetical protein [Shewanella sp. XMDDZSB0408]